MIHACCRAEHLKGIKSKPPQDSQPQPPPASRKQETGFPTLKPLGLALKDDDGRNTVRAARASPMAGEGSSYNADEIQVLKYVMYSLRLLYLYNFLMKF